MILIVDDDMPAATGLERILRYAGYDAAAVSNGMEALSLLAVRKPRLVITDLHMPGLDGLTLTKSIRADAEFAHIPVMFYTSEFSEYHQHAAKAAGAQEYLVKGTLGWEALITRARRLIEQSEQPLRMAE
jgi:PleD family two-component response regulator